MKDEVKVDPVIEHELKQESVMIYDHKP